MSTDRCLVTARVDRHFARKLDAAGELAMREHLPGCAACRARYEKHLLLEKLDPDAAGPRARIASGLGLGAPRPILRTITPVMGALAVAAAIAFLLVRPAGAPLDSGFTARGGGDASAESAYLVVNQGGSRAGETIARNDELTFGYGNTAGKRFLMVFGVDEHRHVFWYYPAWTDPSTDPTSIAITPGARSLPDAVRHDLDGAELSVHAVFTDSPLAVKSVESLISAAPAGKTPSFGAGSIDHTIRFHVQP
jgi:hypothetical protein